MSALRTAKQFENAFRTIYTREGTKFKWLEAHLTFNNYKASMTELANKLGYSNHNVGNSQYGKLARSMTEALKIEKLPEAAWLYTFVTFEKPIDDDWQLTLRPEVVEGYTLFLHSKQP